MTAVPQRQSEIVMRDQDGSVFRSEVLESHPDVLMLRPPPETDAQPTFAVGTRLLVTWPQDGSLWVLPVMMVGNRTLDGVQALVTEVAGDAWREERRHYVRAAIPAVLNLEYHSADADGTAPSSAPSELIDLSEVALRCVISMQDKRLAQPRTRVRVLLAVSGEQFDIPGYVLLGKPTTGMDLGLELVVLFDRPVAQVEQLRRVLAEHNR